MDDLLSQFKVLLNEYERARQWHLTRTLYEKEKAANALADFMLTNSAAVTFAAPTATARSATDAIVYPVKWFMLENIGVYESAATLEELTYGGNGPYDTEDEAWADWEKSTGKKRPTEIDRLRTEEKRIEYELSQIRLSISAVKETQSAATHDGYVKVGSEWVRRDAPKGAGG